MGHQDGLRFERLGASEILDSRGRPTLCVTAAVAGHGTVVAGVPSGASTGSREAAERRDGEPERFGGAGVRLAAAAVEGEIAELLCNRLWIALADVDQALRDLDGTPTKRRLGANATVGVSMAAARGFALAAGKPLYAWLGEQPALAGVAPRLPVPSFNLINGGAHAANRLEFQEFMIAPVGVPSMAEAVRAGAEVYAALRQSLARQGMATGLGDEGGFAPDVRSPEHACQLLVEAIGAAGYDASGVGESAVAIGLDPAANGFRDASGSYLVAGERLAAAALVDRYADMVQAYPLVSIEDGLAEDDRAGWRLLTERLGSRVQLVGDDVFVTDPTAIAAGARERIATAALIKPNQIGTISETLTALQVCRAVGFAAMISHRSGETTDDFIADLAVASGCGQIKSGAPARGERTAKYNRLLAIAREMPELPYGPVPAPPR